jgi:hypothetical protein
VRGEGGHERSAGEVELQDNKTKASHFSLPEKLRAIFWQEA